MKTNTLGMDVVEWRKSRHSNGSGNCVEVVTRPTNIVLVRDSKTLDGPELSFTAKDWRRFITSIRTNS